MTVAFLPLLALGWSKAKAAPTPARMADPAGDVVTHALIAANLWRWDMGLSLTRDGSRLKVEAFLPEDQQSDRSIGQDNAAKVRAAMCEALRSQGYAVRFSDALFCELRKKGWAVVVTAVEVR